MRFRKAALACAYCFFSGFFGAIALVVAWRDASRSWDVVALLVFAALFAVLGLQTLDGVRRERGA